MTCVFPLQENILKLSELNTRKTTISSTYLIRQRFKDTVVNRTLPPLHGGSLEITRTVSLIKLCKFLNLHRYLLWLVKSKILKNSKKYEVYISKEKLIFKTH